VALGAHHQQVDVCCFVLVPVAALALNLTTANGQGYFGDPARQHGGRLFAHLHHCLWAFPRPTITKRAAAMLSKPWLAG